MLLDKINELREKLNEMIASSDVDKEAILVLSRKLDSYIVDYMKSNEKAK